MGKGTFKFSDGGAVVNVTVTRRETNGELMNGSNDTGKTAVEKMVVYSTTDLPSLQENEYRGCKSSVIYRFREVKDSSKIVYATDKTEMLSPNIP